MSARSKRRKQKRADPHSRDHHWVPAAYIGQFAQPRGRDGKIHVWDIRRQRGWIDTPNKVAKAPDLYRLSDGPPQALEERLSHFEGKALAAIREIGESPDKDPSAEAMGALVAFVATQFVRNPERLLFAGEVAARHGLNDVLHATSSPEAYAHYSAKVKDWPRSDPWPTYEQARTYVHSKGFALEFSKNDLLEIVFRTAGDLFNMFMGMRLELVWAGPNQEFVTGDDPVLVVPRPGHVGKPGFENAAGVAMPLTPSLLFVASNDGLTPNRITITYDKPSADLEVALLLHTTSSKIFSRSQIPDWVKDPPSQAA